MRIVLPWLILFLIGCSSLGGNSVATRQYYLLEPSIEAKNSRIEGTPIMSIRRVRLPDYIGENIGLVRRDREGKIRISSLHNWAELLTTAVPNILAMELSTKLKKPVDLHPIPAGYNIQYILEVDILNMIGGTKKNDPLKVEFDFQARYRIIGSDSLKSYRFNITIPLTDLEPETLVAANAKAIQALASDIAMELKNE